MSRTTGPPAALAGEQPAGHDLEGAPAADAELLVVVRREVGFDVAHVLGRALRGEVVHHLLVVGVLAQAGAHEEPQLDEVVEALEDVERLELGERG